MPQKSIMRRPGGGKKGSEGGVTLMKGVLLGLGGLFALGLALMMLKYIIVIGVLGGAGYLGYRLLRGGKALPPGSDSERRSLSPETDDFERQMRELEAIERRLDREISGR